MPKSPYETNHDYANMDESIIETTPSSLIGMNACGGMIFEMVLHA